MNLTQWLTLGRWRGAKVFCVPQPDGTADYEVSISWKADSAEIEDEWQHSTGHAATLDKAFQDALTDPFNGAPRADQPAPTSEQQDCLGCGKTDGCSCFVGPTFPEPPAETAARGTPVCACGEGGTSGHLTCCPAREVVK
jgi:hypothetical protein